MEVVRVAGRYRLYEKVISESTHEVHFARDILSGDNVVVKLEPRDTKSSTLEHEFLVYTKLGRGIGIPRAHWFGIETRFHALVIDQLGPSLEDLFAAHHFRFSLKTVLLLADQLLLRLQHIHARHFVHRDLKPSNIVVGVGKHVDTIYLIDFGLAKQFRNPNTHEHIPFRSGRGFTGTRNFASVNSHLGLELGRRDDLESLAYILIYFLCGSLPWQGRKRNTLTKHKQDFASHTVFQEIPVEFLTFLNLTRSLAFDSKLNYDHYRNLFKDLLVQQGFQSSLTFDWDASNAQRCG